MSEARITRRLRSNSRPAYASLLASISLISTLPGSTQCRATRPKPKKYCRICCACNPRIKALGKPWKCYNERRDRRLQRYREDGMTGSRALLQHRIGIGMALSRAECFFALILLFIACSPGAAQQQPAKISENLQQVESLVQQIGRASCRERV